MTVGSEIQEMIEKIRRGSIVRLLRRPSPRHR